MSKTSLPEPIAAAGKRETPGELIRWTGQPNPGTAFRWSLLIWIFAVPWTAFSLFMTMGVLGVVKSTGTALGPWGTVGGVVGLLFMVPFLAVGAGMMGVPFWAWRRAQATAWVLTDKRLIEIAVYRKLAKVKTIWPERIISIQRSERPDGSGSLQLLLGHRRDSEGDLVSETQHITAVKDVRKLEQLLVAFRPQPTSLPKT